MPDDRRFGVIWLGREALQGAFGLEGAFNEVSVSLLRGTDPQTVIERLDDMLGRYGGVGAYPRADQLSNWFLMNEIEQLRTLASILPTVFLLVAALLTRMVLARLVAVERSEIGLLKAFGYRNRDIAVHYVKLVIAIGAVGVVGGWLVGFWLGRYETRLYADFYRFPFLLYHPGPAFVIAAAVSLGSALAGALGAVREAAALSPAQAMQPPAPPLFRRAAVAEWSVGRRLDQPTRIVLRQILRRPGRSLATSAGIGLAVAVLMVSMQWLDAIRHMVDVYFLQAQAQDVTVGFADPRSAEVLRDLARLPGVQTTEPARVVSAKLLRFHEQREALQDCPRTRSCIVYDSEGRSVDLPSEGLVISTMLADLLGVRRGDRITVEVLEGRRPVVEIPVVELFETYIGTPAYIELGALSRLLYGGRASRRSATGRFARAIRAVSRAQGAAARECGH